MNGLLGSAVVVLAIGLVLVRSATPLARWLAWCLGLWFAVTALRGPAIEWREASAPASEVGLVADSQSLRTAVSAAAAKAGPRAVEVKLQWRESLAMGPEGTLGSVSEMPTALPLQPETLQVRAASAAAIGRPLALQIEGAAMATPLAAELRIWRDDVVLQSWPVALGAGPAAVEFTPTLGGTHRLELLATIGPHQVVARGQFEVAAPPSVLVLEPSGIVAAALRAQGVEVVVGEALPSNLRAHAAIVIGVALVAEEQERLAVAVHDGLGAFVLPVAFAGPGEPMRTLLPLRPAPIEPDAAGTGTERTAGGGESALPNTPPPAPPTEPLRGDMNGAGAISEKPIDVDKHTIAMVLVVDRSGSMGWPLPNGKTKMSYAKTSALRTAQALGDGDMVGLVTFGSQGEGRIELPLTDATQTAVVRVGIERLAHANEMTFLLSGLQRANELLANSSAAIKHIVVITDGEFNLNEGPKMRLDALRMRDASKISLSVISIVSDDTNPLFLRAAEGLTADGGGQFFSASDPKEIPALVSAEVTRSLQQVGRKPRSGEGHGEAAPDAKSDPQPKPPQPAPPSPLPPPPPTAREPVRVTVRAVAESALLLPLPSLAWPTLGRALAGTAPLDARVLLIAGDEGWPLLAFGNRGLGRVGAFAADLCGTDGAEFRADSAFPARLAQWVQSVLPVTPLRLPHALLDEVTVTPKAPTPREVQALAAFSGAVPVPLGSSPAPSPQFVREQLPTTPDAALWLVLAVVGLAAAERWLAARALRSRQRA